MLLRLRAIQNLRWLWEDVRVAQVCYTLVGRKLCQA